MEFNFQPASDSRRKHATITCSQGLSYGDVLRSWRLVALGNRGLLGCRRERPALRRASSVERQDQHGQGDIRDCLRVARVWL